MLMPSSYKILLYLPFYLPNNCFHCRMLGPHLCGCSDALHTFSPWDFWVLGCSEQLETKVPSMALKVCVPLGVQACLLVHRSLQIFPELWFFNLLVSGPFLILEDYQGLHRVFIYFIAVSYIIPIISLLIIYIPISPIIFYIIPIIFL